MILPADSHVHSEWSWDAPSGDMVATCERAVALGLPSLAFTEHLDHTVWRVALDGLAADHGFAASGTTAVDFADEAKRYERAALAIGI